MKLVSFFVGVGDSMSVRALLVGLILLCYSVAQAATLRGVVLANERGGPPLVGVRISAVGANTTTTGEGGTFELNFPRAKPGDKVQLTIAKPGFVVVNDPELVVHLPTNADSDISAFFLCKEGERERWVSQLYRLADRGAIEKRAVELERNGQQAAARIGKSRAEAFVEKDTWGRGTEPPKTNELYAEALPLFLRGDVPGALKVLDDSVLARSMDEAQKRRQEADQSVATIIRIYLFKAHLLVTQFKFDEAESIYLKTIQTAPDNAEAHFYYADFSASLNRRGIARTEFNKVLEIYRRGQAPKFGVIPTLIDLGDLDADDGRALEARKEDQEALALIGSQWLRDPVTYFPLKAGLLNNLGLLDEGQNDIIEAARDYDEALSIYRLLDGENLDDSSTERATTLNNLAKLEIKEGLDNDARSHFEQAIVIYRHLEKKGPGNNLQPLARSLVNLSKLDARGGRMDQAREHIGEALSICQDLVRLNPEAYRPDLAAALSWEASVEARQGRINEARQHFANAVTIFRGLVVDDREAYCADLALTLRNFGFFEKERHQTDAAGTLLREALGDYQELAKRDPHFEHNAREIEIMLEQLKVAAK